MKVNNFSIGSRLTVGLCAILVITTCAAGYAIWCLGDTAAGYKQLTSDSMALERDAQEWVNTVTLSGARNLVTVRFADVENTNDTFSAFNIADPAANRVRVADLLKNINSQLTSEEGKRLMEETLAKRKIFADRQDGSKELLKLGKPQEAQAYAKTQLQPAMKEYIEYMNRVQQHARKLITHRFKFDKILDAYETFGRAADTKALKVIIEA